MISFGKKNLRTSREDRNPGSELRNPDPSSADRGDAASPTAQSAEAAQASGLRHSRPGGLRYQPAAKITKELVNPKSYIVNPHAQGLGTHSKFAPAART